MVLDGRLHVHVAPVTLVAPLLVPGHVLVVLVMVVEAWTKNQHGRTTFTSMQDDYPMQKAIKTPKGLGDHFSGQKGKSELHPKLAQQQLQPLQ